MAEMRTYMQDIDGRNELTTNSVISLHWSSKHDGNFDKHSTFVSGLVLPRAILPLKDSVLVMETGSDSIWRYWDTNNDGTADKWELVRQGQRTGANLEHEGSGLIWAVDNWLYMALSQYRLRWKGDQMISECEVWSNVSLPCKSWAWLDVVGAPFPLAGRAGGWVVQ